MLCMGMSQAPADTRDDPAALKAIIAELQATLRARDLLVQALRIRIAKLQKQAFWASSEKIEREIEQLELALEDLRVATAEADDTPPEEDEAPAEEAEGAPEKTRRRRPRVSEDTPRERRELDPGDACPDCGGDLRVVGEDVSELLDMIAAQIKVIHCPAGDCAAICRKGDRPGEEVLPPLRAHGAGARAEPADPAQHGGAQPAGLHPRLQVRRPRPALSPERDLRPDGRRDPGHDDGRLVRWCDEGSEPADREDRGRRDVQLDPAR